MLTVLLVFLLGVSTLGSVLFICVCIMATRNNRADSKEAEVSQKEEQLTPGLMLRD
jgi:hypothetical protein